MNELLQNLIESLREELKQYGEMLALLDQQQTLVISRRGADLVDSVAEVEAQAESIRLARCEREQRFRDLARVCNLAEASGFRGLVPCLPKEYQPLVGALVEENNELLHRIQKRARQNHLLMSRAVELMKRFINTLIPGTHPTTYTQAGSLPDNPPPPNSFYQAVG